MTWRSQDQNWIISRKYWVVRMKKITITAWEETIRMTWMKIKGKRHRIKKNQI